MSVSKPTNSSVNDARGMTKVVDVAGQVWRHPNPAELYRFVAKRNELLKAIGISRN